MNVIGKVEGGTLVRTDEGDTVPFMVWSHYGEKPGAAEAVFAANQDLSELDHKYGAGAVIFLPELADPSVDVVRIWD